MRSAVAAAVVAIGCTGPDSFYRDAGGPLTGLGGAFGAGGSISGGGSGMGGVAAGVGGAGMGGIPGTGAGGRAGVGGSGMGGASGAGGRVGSGGSGMGGAPGAGGSGVGGGSVGSVGGMTGVGGGGGCAGVYCDNFESDTAAPIGTTPTIAAGWLRDGGSNGEWGVRQETTKVFTQDRMNSTTFRSCYASPAPGAPWSGATTASAQVKISALGSSGVTTALLCLRYTAGAGPAYCLAVLANMGTQIQARTGAVINSSSGVFPATITVGTYYNVQLSINAAGVLGASLNGTPVGTFTPTTTITSGYVAVATQSAEAAFDNVVVTQP